MLFDIRELGWDDELCGLLGVDPRFAARAGALLARSTAATSRVRRRGPGGGDRRRPAGGALRPGLPATRRGQEHLRHRELRPAQHREARRPSRGRGCSPPSPGASGTPGRLRAGGGRLRHRRGRAVAAGRAAGSSPTRPRRRRSPPRSTANDDVYFVPALTGLGSPHWDPYARGTIVGLTRGTGARAPRPRRARVDRLPDRRRRARPGDRVRRERSLAQGRRRRGRQFLADAVPGGRPRRPGDRPGGGRDDRARRRLPGRHRHGAVDAEQVREMWREAARYEPRMAESEREELLGRWREAPGRGWAAEGGAGA